MTSILILAVLLFLIVLNRISISLVEKIAKLRVEALKIELSELKTRVKELEGRGE